MRELTPCQTAGRLCANPVDQRHHGRQHAGSRRSAVVCKFLNRQQAFSPPSPVPTHTATRCYAEPAEVIRRATPGQDQAADAGVLPCSSAFVVRSDIRWTTGNCSTVARWPSTSSVTRTLLPSGNSIASWWRCGTFGSTTPNLATRKLVVLVQIHPWSYLTSCSKANSVPGSRQTATPGSPSAAKPRVEVLGNVVVMSVSPTLAGRDAMACRL